MEKHMKQRTRSLTEGNPFVLILTFAIPIFLGNLFHILYGLVDTKIVGSILGPIALSAVGSVTTLTNLLNGFLNGLALGFSVLTARYFGSGDQKALRKNVGGSVVLGFATVGGIVAVVLIGLHPILRFMNVQAEQYAYAYDYIFIVVLGMLITIGYSLCVNVLRAIGDTVTPLIFLVFSSIVNVVMDYVLILGFHMEVKGAAIATVFSQGISLVLCLIRIRKHFPILHLSVSDFSLEKKQVKEMYQSGLSMGLMSSLVNFGTVILQTGINTFGTNIIVAHTAARKTFEIWNLPISCMGSTMATYCGQNFGAHKYDRIRQGIRCALILCAIWATAVFVMAHTIGTFLISFIASSTEEEVLYWGTKYLEIDMSLIIVTACIVVFRNSMQGFGDYTTPIVSSCIELVCKIIFALFFVKLWGYWAIIFTEPVAWILMVIPLIVMTIRNPIMRGKKDADKQK